MHLPEFTPILAARYSPQTLMMIGAVVTLMVSFLTFARWRLGVKIAFVMVLFEGAIRKWAVPQYQELAYFIKDIFLVGAYLRFYFFPDPAVRAWKLRAPLGVTMLLCVIVSFSALNPNIGSPILALYGLKVYLYYIPLAFMVPYLFKTEDELLKNMFWYCMLATPICLLGIVQFAAPGYSFLNVYAQSGIDTAATTFGFGEKVRITGTFSYLTGHTTFVIVFFAFHLALLMNRLPKWKWACLVINLPLLAANAFMGGSRSSIVSCAAIGIGFVMVSAFQRVGSGRNTILVVGSMVALAMMVTSSYFGEAKEHWMTRMGSGGSRDLVFRVFGMPAKSLGYALEQSGVFGYGIGMTHPAVERLRGVLGIPRPRESAPVFDVEMAQVWSELGILGFMAWYLLRTIFLVHSFSAFLRVPPSPLRSLILAGTLIQAGHFLLSVVLNHTANFLVFAFYGLALIPSLHPAITRKAAPRRQPAAGPPTAPPEPLRPPIRQPGFGPSGGQARRTV